MTIARVVVPACWLIFFLYWTISARSVKPTEERPHGLSRYWHYVPLIVGALLLNIPISPLNFTLIPRSATISILSSGCAVAGLAIALVARHTLAGNWSAVVTFKRDHELITRGIYHYIRHPKYGFLTYLLREGIRNLGIRTTLSVRPPEQESTTCSE